MNNISPLRLVIILGLVSLFADIVYEGARSITGPFLLILGASASLTGLITGLGEFIGYALRLFTGYLADKTNKHWSFIIIGYIITLFSVPLLAFANLNIASLLIITERLGKAIRTPSRDSIIADASKTIGIGKGFGIHEALDQVGAITGPLLIALIIYYNDINHAFLLMFIPSLITLFVLLGSKAYQYRLSSNVSITDKINSLFWVYIIFIGLTMIGFINFQLISYHIKLNSLFIDAHIPLLFALAMAIDALSALLLGFMFDKKGFSILILIPLLTLPILPLVLSNIQYLIILGIIIWGFVMGLHESVGKAVIGRIIGSRMAFGYGILNAIYGISWFVGSLIMGLIYELSLGYLIIFSLIIEIISIIIFINIWRKLKN